MLSISSSDIKGQRSNNLRLTAMWRLCVVIVRWISRPDNPKLVIDLLLIKKAEFFAIMTMVLFSFVADAFRRSELIIYVIC